MPVIKIYSPVHVADQTIRKVEEAGQHIEYKPAQIWPITLPGMHRKDAVWVEVVVQESDHTKPGFGRFCNGIAKVLRDDLDISVEVGLIGGEPMLPLVWAATSEGERKYGPSQWAEEQGS